MNIFILANEAAAEASPLSFKLLPAISTVVVFLVAFGTFAFVVWPKITKALDARDEKILSEIRAAEAAQAKAKAAQSEFEKRLEEARTAADDMIRKARAEADRQADSGPNPSLLCTCIAGRVGASHVFFGQGVHQQSGHHDGQGFAKQCGVDLCDHPSPDQGAQQTRAGSGQQGAPGHDHLAAVLQGGKSRAPDRGAFVGAKQSGRSCPRKGGKQGGDQNQAAAAHNRIHQTGQKQHKQIMHAKTNTHT